MNKNRLRVSRAIVKAGAFIAIMASANFEVERTVYFVLKMIQSIYRILTIFRKMAITVRYSKIDESFMLTYHRKFGVYPASKLELKVFE